MSNSLPPPPLSILQKSFFPVGCDLENYGKYRRAILQEFAEYIFIIKDVNKHYVYRTTTKYKEAASYARPGIATLLNY